MSFDPGDVWRPTVEVRDSSGNLTSATVTILITSPSGVTSSPAVSGSGGTYTADVPLTEAGQWQAKWTVSGAVTAVEYQTTLVRRAGSNPIGVEEVKNRLHKSVTKHLDDNRISDMLDAAIAEYEQWVGPVTGSVTELYSGGGTTLVLSSPNVAQITALSYTDGTSVNVADLDLNTATGVLGWGYGTTGRFTGGVRNVQVTYTVGPLPANHREAIIADVAGYFNATQRGPQPLSAEEGYGSDWNAHPTVLFPRIRALAGPSVA